MRNRVIVLLLSLASAHFWSCVPADYGKETYSGIAVDFNDKLVQEVYNLQERQSVDSLMLFLSHENPTLRYVAANAFAALKDTVAIDTLGKLLKDAYIDVRVAAAHAIGQIGHFKGADLLVKNYENRDTLDQFGAFNGAVLEAIGKCGTMRHLNYLCNIRTFRMGDTALLEGQSYGILRFGLRDSFNLTAIKKMLDCVAEKRYPSVVRVNAAYYLARLKTKYDTSVTNAIGRLVLTESDANVRMSLARALGKAYNPLFVLNTLESLNRQETDYRVRVNLLNALNDFNYAQVQPLVISALQARNVHVANAAAQYILRNGTERDALFYKSVAFDPNYGVTTRRIMMAAALKYLRFYPRQRDSVNRVMIDAYKSTPSAYDKAQILRGLSEFGWNYEYIRDEALNPANPAMVRTTGAEALAALTTAPDFFARFKGYSLGVKKQLVSALFALIRTGDAGAATVAADALRNPAAGLNAKLLADSIPTLYQVMQRFKLPDELEAYESLFKTIQFLGDTTIKKKSISAPRTIDWMTINSLGDFATATVKTNKGEIRIRLLTRKAPISVASFVALSRSGFFNGKYFHRVVPNFVIQTGCPRGDGYGSLDFTLSSELPLVHYDTEGYVGMASAGNHTECSQWFVTQSPTPHLDPNYTIFGKVVEGMDVVQRIEIGDSIESVVVN